MAPRVTEEGALGPYNASSDKNVSLTNSIVRIVLSGFLDVLLAHHTLASQSEESVTTDSSL